MVNVRKSLVDERFGRLTVIKQVEDYIRPDGRREAQWLCQCDCGNMIVAKSDNLKSGNTKSCGCLQREKTSEIGSVYGKIPYKPKHPKVNRYDLTHDYGIGYTNLGEAFYFDKEDYDKIKGYCWYIHYNYVSACSKSKSVSQVKLHRLVMDAPKGKVVDHINGNPLDNRKCNLRICSAQENALNRKSNREGFCVGVTFHKYSGLWQCQIQLKGKSHCKYFKSYDEAVAQRIEWEKELFGEFGYNHSQEIAKENKLKEKNEDEEN